MLTDNGYVQIHKLSESWKKQIYFNNASLPQLCYGSPMRRCLQTYNHMRSSILNGTKVPLIKEFTRETYGIYSQNRRHNKTYIEGVSPDYKFQNGFYEQDELWKDDKDETSKYGEYRATVLFNDIFSSDSTDIISIKTHYGTILSMLKVLEHRMLSLETGQMIPVLIKASDFGKRNAPSLDDSDWDKFATECDSFLES